MNSIVTDFKMLYQKAQLLTGLGVRVCLSVTLNSAFFPPIRSPWSNKYDPPIEDGAMPSDRLRKLEIEANNAFDQYRDL